MSKSHNLTTISVSQKNYSALKKRGGAGDSFNDVITMILEELGSNVNEKGGRLRLLGPEPLIVEPSVSPGQSVSKAAFHNPKCLSREKVSSKQDQPLAITITECLSAECTAFYTDSISKSIVIQCKDPRHNNQKQSAGQVTNPRPAPDDASFTQTKVNSHEKEGHT